MLDKSELAHMVDEIPLDKEAAGKLGEEVILQNYNISRKNFEHYFFLNKSNKTQFRWMLYYDVGKIRASREGRAFRGAGRNDMG